MSVHSRRAFTHVDLFVVVGVIGMLIALLLPLLLTNRVQDGRQTHCQKQMKDLVSATLQFAMRKNRLPGYAETWSVSDGAGSTQNYDIGWAPQMFAYLDMQERQLDLMEWTDIDGVTGPDFLDYIPLLTCPSDPPDLEAPLWSDDDCGTMGSTYQTAAYPLSYAVNGGRADDVNEQTPDEREYAVFHDRRSGANRVVVTLDDLTDGKAQTLLLTENVDMTNWASNTTTNSVSEVHQAVVYSDAGFAVDPHYVVRLASQVPLNTEIIAPYDCDEDGLADNLDFRHARPSSFHQEGFNVANADGSVQFFFVDPDAVVAYSHYVSKMTPASDD